MEGEAWQATVLGVAKSRTQLSDFTIKYYLDIILVKMIYIPIKSLILLPQTTDGSQTYCTDFTITEVNILEDRNLEISPYTEFYSYQKIDNLF